MTQGMLDLLWSDEAIEAEYLTCAYNHEKALEAVVNLPATAASGEPVSHGANVVMVKIADYWKRRMTLIDSYRR